MQPILDFFREQPMAVYGAAVAVILFIVVKTLLKVIGDGFGNSSGASAPTDFPYERAEYLSAAERSFLGALDLALGSRYRIFAKVRLADLIKTRAKLGGRRRQAALNAIISKHVDFVLCDPATMEAVMVVELDDASHNSSRQREKDQWKDKALRAASIPVVRIAAARSYATADLVERIDPERGIPSVGAGA
jgi:very-short-patch-repair endonuclease